MHSEPTVYWSSSCCMKRKILTVFLTLYVINLFTWWKWALKSLVGQQQKPSTAFALFVENMLILYNKQVQQTTNPRYNIPKSLFHFKHKTRIQNIAVVHSSYITTYLLFCHFINQFIYFYLSCLVPLFCVVCAVCLFMWYFPAAHKLNGQRINWIEQTWIEIESCWLTVIRFFLFDLYTEWQHLCIASKLLYYFQL